jgi:hypothetical protein
MFIVPVMIDANGIDLLWAQAGIYEDRPFMQLPPPMLQCPVSVEKFIARAHTYHSKSKVPPPERRFFRGYSDRGRNGF